MVLRKCGFGKFGAISFNFEGATDTAGSQTGSTKAVLDVSGVVEPSISGASEVGALTLHENHLGGISLALLKHPILKLDDRALHDNGSAVVLQELIVVSH